jgi:hypothetical protein
MKSVFDDSAYRNKPGFIYLIHAKGTRRYKIGLTTRNVEQRFNELNSSQSPYPLELIEFIETHNVTETEEYLHQKYDFQRRHGEWFEFNNRQLREVLREYDRLENGDRGWFRFPSLPCVNLPSLPSFGSLSGLRMDRNTLALVVAGIGSFWLMIAFHSCQSQPSPQQQPVSSVTGRVREG